MYSQQKVVPVVEVMSYLDIFCIMSRLSISQISESIQAKLKVLLIAKLFESMAPFIMRNSI